MLSVLAITVELVGTCTQLKASCSRMQLQIHYHDLFVPSAVDSLCPAVVAPLLAFFFNVLQVLQWPSMARVHLRCYSYEFHWPVCSKFLIQPWQRRLYGLVVLEQVPIMLCSSLVNYSWRQPENAVACVRCPI